MMVVGVHFSPQLLFSKTEASEVLSSSFTIPHLSAIWTMNVIFLPRYPQNIPLSPSNVSLTLRSLLNSSVAFRVHHVLHTQTSQSFLETVEVRLERLRLLIERLQKEEAKDRKIQLGMTVRASCHETTQDETVRFIPSPHISFFRSLPVWCRYCTRVTYAWLFPTWCCSRQTGFFALFL